MRTDRLNRLSLLALRRELIETLESNEIIESFTAKPSIYTDRLSPNKVSCKCHFGEGFVDSSLAFRTS